MAELKLHQPRVVAQASLILSEEEILALDALVGYGDDAFLNVFYTHMGRAYLGPYEHGLRSFFQAIRATAPGVLQRVDAAHRALQGGAP